jgi:hypothetical protein
MFIMARCMALAASAVILSINIEGCGDPNPAPSRRQNKKRRNGDGPTPRPNTIPTILPVHDSCKGNGLGLYTWGHEMWNMEKSPLIDFLLNDNVREFACGDIYINVSDYSAPEYIPNDHFLVPFIRNIRATGNRAIVYLVYGDVHVSGNGAPNGPYDFVNTFFDWVSKLSQAEMDAIMPIGLSYDCENISKTVIENSLTLAQKRKAALVTSHLRNDPSNLIIQWTIEGQRKPADTDVIMKLADSALMMLYRNHVAPSIRDPAGVDTLVDRMFDYMLTMQCKYCLDDEYAIANYKAKITVMVEADCTCGNSCGKISFCAFDASEPAWGGSYPNGALYMMDTLAKAEKAIRARLSTERFERLFGKPTAHNMFVVHNWQWFTCFFKDPSVEVQVPWGRKKDHTCKKYHSDSRSCKKH